MSEEEQGFDELKYSKRQMQAIHALEKAFARSARWGLEFMISPGNMSAYPKGTYDKYYGKLNDAGKPYSVSEVANKLNPIDVDHHDTIVDAGD